ncbi:nitrate ABC transporter permease [Microvirga lotononidis]|uniref:Nitrate ABC transporter, permease protein n=1 Tax=Microvirga lotononidis TaxID=864069 RepID=I4YRW2_9HYPH|nr:nitrate ABC transporter permease [Microvirga lotononidis]EIM26704.1 nitrate ABC transporter, permease protein [Microvirga lotononidis]WQO31622.1 nitrate ABC transporter permease [Microvirga lotononidis]
MVHSARVVALPNPKAAPPAQKAALHPLAPKPVGVLSRAARIGMSIVTQLAAPVLTIAFLLILWQILASSSTSALPSPLKVIDDSWEIIVNPFKVGNGLDQGLFWHVTASLVRVGYGYTLAAIVGIGMGVLLGQSTLAMRGLDPVFQVLRTIPPLAWLPLSLAAFRDGQPSAIFVIFITSVWPILINTSVGIRNIPRDYRNVAKVLRLSPIEFFTRIMVPATVPHMFTGLRIGIGLSWLAIVAAEMLIGGVGIGFFIWDAWNSSLISDIIVALVYVGVVGFLLDRSIAAIGHLLTRGTAAQ